MCQAKIESSKLCCIAPLKSKNNRGTLVFVCGTNTRKVIHDKIMKKMNKLTTLVIQLQIILTLQL